MANTDYGAVLLTTCEATSQALNQKLGVSTGFAPSEWANAIASIQSFVPPVNIRRCTKSEYEAIASPSDDTIYLIAPYDSANSLGQASTCEIFVGANRIFPAPKTQTGYDWYGANMVFPDTNAPDAYDGRTYDIETGIAINSADNVSRNWQMEFMVTPASTWSGDNVIIGCSADGMVREIYLKKSGGNNCLYLYINGYGDTRASNEEVTGVAIKIVKNGTTGTVYFNDTVITTFTFTETVYNNTLGIGKYKSANRFYGTINYFKFKWLS